MDMMNVLLKKCSDKFRPLQKIKGFSAAKLSFDKKENFLFQKEMMNMSLFSWEMK